MKKYIFLLILLTTINTQAQEYFSSYENSYHGFENRIFMTLNQQNFTLLITGLPAGEIVQVGGIAIMENKYNQFIDGIKHARNEYSNWKKKSIAGKEKELSKSLRMFVNSNAFFKTNIWHYDHNFYLKFQLISDIQEDTTNYYLAISTGPLSSSYNHNIKSPGFNIIFSSEEEISNFLNAISKEKINDHILTINHVSEKIKEDIKKKRHEKIEKRPWLSHIEYGISSGYFSAFAMNTKPIEPVNQFSLVEPMTNLYTGFNNGVFGRIYLKKFLFQPEILYSSGNGMSYFSFLDRSKQQIIMKRKNVHKTLEVPLLLGYNFMNKNKFKISVVAGPQFSFDMGSASKTEYYHTLGDYISTDASYKINKFRTGITGAAMFDYSRFSLSVRYHYFQNKFETTFDGYTFDKMATPTLSFTAAWKIFEPIK